jgi:Mrp family chromosome partitioning ATPase
VIYLNLSKEYRKIKSRIVDEFKALGQEADIDVKLAPKEADSEKSRTGKNLSGIKRIIAVSSCKGGVGKSSVAVNLAYSLHKYLGKKVGIFDADIHGPSIPTMLKKERATLEALENDPKTIIPIEYEGVKVRQFSNFPIFPKKVIFPNFKTMSYGYASQNNRAVIRGLMATQVLMQLLTVIFSEKNLPSR